MKTVRSLSNGLILLSLSLVLVQCTKNATDTSSATEQTLIKNPWSVDYYFNTLDLTNTYSSSRLLFSSTGAVGYQKDGQTITGKWSRSVDASNNELISLQFNTGDPNIEQLNKSWKLMDRTTNSIQFEKTDGNTNILFRLKTE